jgi:MFS family permease
VVQEAKPEISLSYPLSGMYGNRTYVWIRFSDDQRSSNCPFMGNLYEPLLSSPWATHADRHKDFDNPQGSLKGIIAAAYSLGAILSLPFIPMVNDKYGRRWSIVGGSVIMIIGALIQGFSQHGTLALISLGIYVCSNNPWE